MRDTSAEGKRDVGERVVEMKGSLMVFKEDGLGLQSQFNLAKWFGLWNWK